MSPKKLSGDEAMSPQKRWKLTIVAPSGQTEDLEVSGLRAVAKVVERERDAGNGVTVWELTESKARRYLERLLAPCRQRHRGRL
jgi:hypothetical protein